MITTKLKIFKDGQDTGYIGKKPLWWFDKSIPNAFSIFDLDSFYQDDYFKKDHVSPELVDPIVDLILENCSKFTNNKIKSAIEFGCGGGWFTKSLIDRKIDVIGIEGASVGIKKCLERGIPKSLLLKMDLRLPINLERKFDIALCSEVAEHIEPPFAATLIQSIVKHSNVVWFSSEEPGTNRDHYHHSNEQPEVYWKNIFQFFGYQMYKLPKEITDHTFLRGKQIFYK